MKLQWAWFEVFCFSKVLADHWDQYRIEIEF